MLRPCNTSVCIQCELASNRKVCAPKNSLLLLLLAVFAINSMPALPADARKFGFANTTALVSNEFYLQITPAGWTFAIWRIVFAWQLLWIIYALSFVFRSSAPLTVSRTSQLLYLCANVGTIVWLYVWGNNLPQIPLPGIAPLCLAAAGVQAVHIYRLTSSLQNNKIDLWITRLLVTNGLAIYATWSTVATLINLGIVLQYYAGFTAGTTGTLVLWMLSFIELGYFALENTVLDRFTRFIFVVYPTFIWALSGVLSAHWGKEVPDTNPLLTLILLVFSVVLFIVRAILVAIFAVFRPIPYPSLYSKLPK